MLQLLISATKTQDDRNAEDVNLLVVRLVRSRAVVHEATQVTELIDEAIPASNTLQEKLNQMMHALAALQKLTAL